MTDFDIFQCVACSVTGAPTRKLNFSEGKKDKVIQLKELFCFIALHAFLFLRALRIFTFKCRTCPHYFTSLTCLDFFTCFTYPRFSRTLRAFIFLCAFIFHACLHFFTCLTCPHLFMCLTCLHFLCAFIFLACLHFFMCLTCPHLFMCLTCLHFLRTFILLGVSNFRRALCVFTVFTKCGITQKIQNQPQQAGISKNEV